MCLGVQCSRNEITGDFDGLLVGTFCKHEETMCGLDTVVMRHCNRSMTALFVSVCEVDMVCVCIIAG